MFVLQYNFSANMEVNSDPELQRCLGLGQASGDAGAEIGGRVVQIIGQLTEMLISKTVVGEEFEIDTKTIKVLASKMSGEQAKEPFSVLNTGIKVDLPDHFCLERMEGDVCNSPVAVSATVYKINPRVNQ